MNKFSYQVNFLDAQYRKGMVLISNAEFDQLENNLIRIDPKNDYFNQKLVLPSLDNDPIELSNQ